MRATNKILKNISGIVQEELFIHRYILRFSNYQEAIWKGKKHLMLF